MKIIKKNKAASKVIEAATDKNILAEETLPTLSAANIQAMFNSPEFKTIPSEAETARYLAQNQKPVEENLDDVEGIDEESVTTCIENYLKEAYSTVSSFKITSTQLNKNQLIVEGRIAFKNGKNKRTIFEFLSDGKNLLKGNNKGIAEDASFILAYTKDNSKLLAECLKYSHSIKNSLVEGLSKYN